MESLYLSAKVCRQRLVGKGLARLLPDLPLSETPGMIARSLKENASWLP
jgi:hypothetical protein